MKLAKSIQSDCMKIKKVKERSRAVSVVLRGWRSGSWFDGYEKKPPGMNRAALE
jgi:hypothetical protein